MMSSADTILVFISHRDNTCSACHEELGKGSWITLERDRGATCLSCADLDHLVYLPAGNAALTRRAKKHSTLSAVVLKWSRARKRNERQGLLVEQEALDRSEKECSSLNGHQPRFHIGVEVKTNKTGESTGGSGRDAIETACTQAMVALNGLALGNL